MHLGEEEDNFKEEEEEATEMDEVEETMDEVVKVVAASAPNAASTPVKTIVTTAGGQVGSNPRDMYITG